MVQGQSAHLLEYMMQQSVMRVIVHGIHRDRRIGGQAGDGQKPNRLSRLRDGEIYMKSFSSGPAFPLAYIQVKPA